jgi:hypothetical protein
MLTGRVNFINVSSLQRKAGLSYVFSDSDSTQSDEHVVIHRTPFSVGFNSRIDSEISKEPTGTV